MHDTTIRNLIDMFIDRTAGEWANDARLITRETESGNVALIGYGWLKLAEYDEERGVVTLYTGHENLNSKTVNEWLNRINTRAQSRGRSVVASGDAPNWDQPNEGTEYINNYVNFQPDQSAVERDAMARVRDSLKHLKA